MSGTLTEKITLQKFVNCLYIYGVNWCSECFRECSHGVWKWVRPAADCHPVQYTRPQPRQQRTQEHRLSTRLHRNHEEHSGFHNTNTGLLFLVSLQLDFFMWWLYFVLIISSIFWTNVCRRTTSFFCELIWSIFFFNSHVSLCVSNSGTNCCLPSSILPLLIDI